MKANYGLHWSLNPGCTAAAICYTAICYDAICYAAMCCNAICFDAICYDAMHYDAMFYAALIVLVTNSLSHCNFSTAQIYFIFCALKVLFFLINE